MGRPVWPVLFTKSCWLTPYNWRLGYNRPPSLYVSYVARKKKNFRGEAFDEKGLRLRGFWVGIMVYIHCYMYIHTIHRPGPFTRQLVERMRQDHRVNRTSENCVSMYVFVPSNFLLMLYYIILNLKKEYGNCGGRVNLKVGQPKTETKTETKKKKNMIQYPIAAYHIALCHVHIYRLDTSETFSFFKEPGRGRKEGEGEKEGEKDDLFLSMMSDLSVWSP